MIISNHQIQQILRNYGVQKTQGPKGASGPAPAPKAEGDKTVLSPEGQLWQKVAKAVKDAPEIRPQRVQELRQAIATGTYHVSGQEVAEKMVGRSLVDKLV